MTLGYCCRDCDIAKIRGTPPPHGATARQDAPSLEVDRLRKGLEALKVKHKPHCEIGMGVIGGTCDAGCADDEPDLNARIDALLRG